MEIEHANTRNIFYSKESSPLFFLHPYTSTLASHDKFTGGFQEYHQPMKNRKLQYKIQRVSPEDMIS